MSAAATLVRRLREQRRFWVDLGEGLAVCLERPGECHLFGLRTLGVDAMAALAVDWRGFTEAVLFGPEIGNPDPLPFDSEAWAAIYADRLDWHRACVQRFSEVVDAHLTARGLLEKN